ncbi:carboxypeptidase-like regulatory domain-containing protein [Hymenobacter sp. 15J16-1T3B]|uniref:carboxypeptidase-like regulatory domain-containing protein n=1 Tax=Hymenobacter sp. 15J16-1T3B TaxID=2886941 RepID=UPI001D110638|nr:carboxypeptidase-like regulatory domain-containing protein [Hymenobacter sp. 15J16-1T3B]MCC3158072.1 carboxypeptidase-like regulatory domain-containing protein [Hymenobacter sp. 15J16-1T3B]
MIRFKTMGSGGAVLLLSLLLALPAAAQKRLVRVTGSVSERQTRKPIPGASVINLSTRRGVVADEQGDFDIKVNSTDTLEFRAVGFQPYRLPLGDTGLSQLIVQVKLDRASVQLTGVTIREGRPNDQTIARALRNVRRQAPPPNAVKRAPRPQPLFPVDSAAPKAPVATLQNPISMLYDQFSREGAQRRKLEEIEEEKRVEAEIARRRAYNRYFRINKGYEVERDSSRRPVTAPWQLPSSPPAVPVQPVQPPAGALAPKP